MTASYSTIPADVDSSAEPLLNKPVKTSLKRIFVAAAVTSFALGVVAATALSPASGIPAKIEMDSDDCVSKLKHGYCTCAADEAMCDNDGGHGYQGTMESLACTPYAYAPHPPSLYGLDPDEEDYSDPFNKIMLLGRPNQQGAWGTKSKKEFFVFRGNDGSGVQSDCLGDNANYVERFGRPATGNKHGEDPDGKLDENGQLWEWVNTEKKEEANFNDVMPPEGFCWDEDFGVLGERHYCHMGHPGTKVFYEDYTAGWANLQSEQNVHVVDWWSTVPAGDCGDMGSVNSGCWDQWYIDSITKEIGEEQSKLVENYPGRAISFMTLPWVCAHGAETPGENIFSWPTIADWNWKCYADN